MRLRRLLQRCRLGRSARMPPKVEDTMVGVGMEATGGATITTPKVAVEDMREEAEEDMETGEAEEEAAEGGRCREAGEMEVEEGEAVTIRATIKMQEVIRGEEGEVVTEEGTTKEASRMLATMEEEEALTMTTTNKTETGIRREVGVEEVGEAGEEEVEEEEEDKEEAGEGEEARILTKEVSLNSFFSTAGSTTTKLVLIKADTTPVEDAVWGTVAESIQINGSSRLYRFEMPYHFEFSAWLKVDLNIK